MICIIKSWVWAGNAPDQVSYCYGIWSWNNFATTNSGCDKCLPILVCRQMCNRYWNVSSEILVCRPGSHPLCGLIGGAMANNKLFTIWYMQQHGSKYFARRHTLYPCFELHYIKAWLELYSSEIFIDQNWVLLVQEGLLSVSSVGMCMKYC